LLHLLTAIFGCRVTILSPTERIPSHSASSSDCRHEFVLKGPGPPFSQCQVTPPVVLVVIVSTRNHAMINAYLRERMGDQRSSPNRSFLMNPGRDISKASKVYRRCDSVRDGVVVIESSRARTR